MHELIVIVGPTGSGKSNLGLRLARRFDAEIVGADSRQLFRYLDIGTAKPTIQERAEIPHHLIDITEPGLDYNLADYQGLVYRTIGGIQSRGRLPILVGGSGQYIWSALEGWQIPRVQPNAALRQTLEKRARDEGGETLYLELQNLDPLAATRIDSHNIRRVIRALEIHESKKGSVDQLPAKATPPYRMLMIGLTADRETLYRRIDSRVDKMIENGLVEEAQSVLAMGFPADAPGLNSIGYKETVSYLKGELDLKEMTDRVKAESHRLVRHQYNWFRLEDKRIHWLDISAEYFNQAVELVAGFLKEKRSEYGFY
jgi:tRNA dimethylallyltransferase